MKHTVLLVEDESDLLELMREALEHQGYTVIAAHDGQEALDQLDGVERVCLVLLDLLMPRMNGWDFFMKFRARPEFAGVPVVIHSSDPTQAPAGATRVIKKPMQLDRLLSAVREFCGP